MSRPPARGRDRDGAGPRVGRRGAASPVRAPASRARSPRVRAAPRRSVLVAAAGTVVRKAPASSVVTGWVASTAPVGSVSARRKREATPAAPFSAEASRTVPEATNAWPRRTVRSWASKSTLSAPFGESGHRWLGGHLACRGGDRGRRDGPGGGRDRDRGGDEPEQRGGGDRDAYRAGRASRHVASLREGGPRTCGRSGEERATLSDSYGRARGICRCTVRMRARNGPVSRMAADDPSG